MEGEKRDCGRMKDDFGCLVLILILWKGSSRRIKDDFVCRSYFDSLEGKKWENQCRLCFSFLF